MERTHTTGRKLYEPRWITEKKTFPAPESLESQRINFSMKHSSLEGSVEMYGMRKCSVDVRLLPKLEKPKVIQPVMTEEMEDLKYCSLEIYGRRNNRKYLVEARLLPRIKPPKVQTTPLYHLPHLSTQHVDQLNETQENSNNFNYDSSAEYRPFFFGNPKQPLFGSVAKKTSKSLPKSQGRHCSSGLPKVNEGKVQAVLTIHENSPKSTILTVENPRQKHQEIMGTSSKTVVTLTTQKSYPKTCERFEVANTPEEHSHLGDLGLGPPLPVRKDIDEVKPATREGGSASAVTKEKMTSLLTPSSSCAIKEDEEAVEKFVCTLGRVLADYATGKRLIYSEETFPPSNTDLEAKVAPKGVADDERKNARTQ